MDIHSEPTEGLVLHIDKSEEIAKNIDTGTCTLKNILKYHNYEYKIFIKTKTIVLLETK